jgi:leader peptidase (prepilin peptidase)/N-methyltransferase
MDAVLHGLRIGAFAVLGLAAGSFLTVVVHRLPLGESVVRPRSACPRCGASIRGRDNVPLLSYALLRGRCRGCRTRISAEYPAVEAVTAALFVAAALVFASTWSAAIAAVLLGVALAAGLIDARHRVIPNRLTLPALVVVAALVLAAWLAGGPVRLAGAALGMLAMGGGLLIVAVVAPHGMGMGDVKFAAVIGLALGSLGLRHVAVAAVAAVLAGGVAGVVALAAGRGRRDTLPFGPYLGVGALAAVAAAPQVAAWYSGLLR